eukprot:m.16667 g.16667  ORF g.16667 m.16667 type:complete len:185 (-) comp11153_c0_seq1:451-1005(-)
MSRSKSIVRVILTVLVLSSIHPNADAKFWKQVVTAVTKPLDVLVAKPLKSTTKLLKKIPVVGKPFDKFINVVLDSSVNTAMIPVPGPHCGPESSLAKWLVPDKMRFGMKVVHLDRACQKHDTCYDQCGGRTACDDQFYTDLKSECSQVLSKGIARTECNAFLAKVYYEAVKSGGDAHYPSHCDL